MQAVLLIYWKAGMADMAEVYFKSFHANFVCEAIYTVKLVALACPILCDVFSLMDIYNSIYRYSSNTSSTLSTLRNLFIRIGEPS